MQKKIIALAVAGLMSGAAFAQSNVTISGLLDMGYLNTSSEGLSSSANVAYNNTATSSLTIAAKEAIGGGMYSGVTLETDLRGPNAGSGMLASFQRFVYLGKDGIGELSFGQRTNHVTTSAVTVQPFGTAMGGGYGGSFNRNRGGGFEATGAWSATGRDVRPDAAIHLRSATFSGVSFGLDYKPTNDSTAPAEAVPSTGYLGLGINYNNGPLNLTFANSKARNTTAAAAVITVVDANANGVVDAGETTIATTAAYNSNVRNTILGGNYTFGAFTGYLGWTRSNADTSAAAGDEADSRSWNIGLKYTMGNWAFLANVIKDDDKLAANVDRKLTGLGVDYSLSKRTAAYVRWVDQDNSSNAAGGKLTQTAFGLRHSF